MSCAESVGRLGQWLRHPVVRDEVRRRRYGRWAALLGGLNLLFLAAFAGAALQPHATSGRVPAMTAAFNPLPWLLLGTALLSLCAHWLVPPFLLGIPGRRHDLRTLILMVRERCEEEEVLRGQVAAGVLPVLVGAVPLVLGVPVVAYAVSRFLPHALGGLAAAGLWGGLCASVSLWSSSRWRETLPAGFWTYTLTCAVLPAATLLLARVVAAGCSAGRTDHELVFYISGGLTWGILVLGLAAAFWDATLLRLFPERRRPLWADPPPAPRLEP